MKRTTSLLAIVGMAALLLTTASANAAAVPIAGTGFSVDAIVEAGATDAATGAPYAGWASWVLAEVGAPGIGAGTPLPSGGLVTTKNGTQFQLEPYTGNNTLVNGDTFTLDTPGSYNDLRFFITGIGGGTADNFQATINFSDASSALFSFSVADWQGSRDYNAFDEKTAYVRRTSGSIGLWTRELVYPLDLGDQTKTIESIDFALADRLGLSAVSGTIPEPTSLVLAGLGLFGLVTRRRRTR